MVFFMSGMAFGAGIVLMVDRLLAQYSRRRMEKFLNRKVEELQALVQKVEEYDTNVIKLRRD